MPPLTIAYRDEAERLALEQALAFFPPSWSWVLWPMVPNGEFRETECKIERGTRAKSLLA